MMLRRGKILALGGGFVNNYERVCIFGDIFPIFHVAISRILPNLPNCVKGSSVSYSVVISKYTRLQVESTLQKKFFSQRSSLPSVVMRFFTSLAKCVHCSPLFTTKKFAPNKINALDSYLIFGGTFCIK